MIHVIQGVFDLTAANSQIVGTDAINTTGTATEFVAARWDFLVASVAVWRIYDIGLLALAGIHGFNGLRYVLTDYTMHNPLLRRASIYLCVIGAVTLLIVGGAALLGSIQSDALQVALESQCKLGITSACQ
jgi:succinate dehydrogenase hydrophobic anchor subunit